jgi:hypothetical protein
MASPIHASAIREVPSVPAEGSLIVGAAALPLQPLTQPRLASTVSLLTLRSDIDKEKEDIMYAKTLKKSVGSSAERQELMLEWLLEKYSA